MSRPKAGWSLRIAGMGWVTPLGSGVPAVWDRLLKGDEPPTEAITSPLHARTFQVFRVPTDALAKAPAHPRLRRSSSISKFAAAAGLAALEGAHLELDPAAAERTAIIFAISNGGVIYTKRFYHDVVEAGAQAASPLLFPETVFNAPASHLAAILGITGASYTLVGDGAVGLLALKMAEDLMQNGSLDRCLVVGAEEADWLLCDAYHRWRLLRAAPPIEVFQAQSRGTILSEGAGALLLESEGFSSARPGQSEDRPAGSSILIERIDPGSNFYRRSEAAACLEQILHRLGANNGDIVIASANGTFIDKAESAALLRYCPAATVYAPKASLGESVGAGGIWQVICAALALAEREVPPTLHAFQDHETRPGLPGPSHAQFRRAIVTTCGLNQQAAGLSLQLPP